MRDCRMCDQSGIVYLQPGNIKAPCLECSFDRKLDDLEDELARKIAAEEELEVRRQIKDHNDRMKTL